MWHKSKTKLKIPVEHKTESSAHLAEPIAPHYHFFLGRLRIRTGISRNLGDSLFPQHHSSAQRHNQNKLNWPLTLAQLDEQAAAEHQLQEPLEAIGHHRHTRFLSLSSLINCSSSVELSSLELCFFNSRLLHATIRTWLTDDRAREDRAVYCTNRDSTEVLINGQNSLGSRDERSLREEN